MNLRGAVSAVDFDGDKRLDLFTIASDVDAGDLLETLLGKTGALGRPDSLDIPHLSLQVQLFRQRHVLRCDT